MNTRNATPPQEVRQIVFIDAQVPDVAYLLAQLEDGVQAHLLQAGGDGLLQIARVLREMQQLKAIHIVAHGQPGALMLGSSRIDAEAVEAYRAELRTLGIALADDGMLQLYACDVAQGTTGAAFIKQLSRAIGADVAASDGKIGAAELGGSWAIGGMMPFKADVAQWRHVLAGDPLPMAYIAISDTTLGVGETATVTIVFSEEVSNFSNADLTVTNGALSNVATTDNITWTATFTPAPGITDATNVIILNMTTVEDGAAQAGKGSVYSDNFAIDTRQKPTIDSVVEMDGGLINADEAASSEGGGAGSVVVVGIDDSGAVAGDTLTVHWGSGVNAVDIAYTLLQADITAGTVSVLIPEADITSQGNSTFSITAEIDEVGVPSDPVSVTTTTATGVDVLPTGTVTLSDYVLAAGQTATVTFAFTEVMSDFTLADVTVQNGTFGALSAATPDGDGGETYTVTFTPTTNLVDLSNLITVDMTAVGTGGTTGANAVGTISSPSYVVDTLLPTLVITMDKAELAADETATVTFTFNQEVSGFVLADDATADNGVLSNLVNVDNEGIVYTATFTPAPGTARDITNTISVDMTGVSAVSSGAAGVGSVSLADDYIVDTMTPGDLTLEVTADGVTVDGLEVGATWQYSTDGGDSWEVGTGESFVLASGSYASGDIKVKQFDEVGNVSAIASIDDTFGYFVGTDNGEVLNGLATADILYGKGGDDTLDGKAGADEMFGGLGSDIYVVDSVGDVVTEAAGEGTADLVKVAITAAATYTLTANVENATVTSVAAINLTGNALANILTGNSAANILDGGAEADTMNGGAGNDTYVVDNLLDRVFENASAGTDLVKSSVDFTLGDNVENLTLTGADAIEGIGNLLANTIDGSQNAAANELTGGAGNDIYIVGALDTVVEGVNAGTDTVQSAITYTLAANLENLTLTGTDHVNGTGNTANNTLVGNDGNNTLAGGAGNDTMNGGLGNDRLDGGDGTDLMAGGQGDDTYVVGILGDSVTEYFGEGDADTVESSITYTLGSYLENLTLVGVAAINGTGNTLANTLTGNAAANTLSGGAGADTMVGEDGDDIYVVDNINDVVTEVADEGNDTVNSSVTYTLAANVDNLTLTGSAVINGTGNADDNILTGNAAANILTGGDGDDTYYVASGDTVVEAADEGDDLVISTVTHTLAVNVDDLELTGTATINGTGNALANTLTGNGAANILDGGAGADSMAGGLGNDVYKVDNAGDTVTENANAGTDRVESSVTFDMGANGANVENLTLTGSAAIDGTGNGLANVIIGNDNANDLLGGAGNDTLKGGGGADTLDGQTGTDKLEGGSGSDTYTVDIKKLGTTTTTVALEDAVTEVADSLKVDTDEIVLRGSWATTNDSTLTVANYIEDFDASATGTTKINVTGNTLDNVITGNDAANTLSGGAGVDTLNGGLGNDTLNGGTGADTMVGGEGDDIYVRDNAGDVITEASGEGDDTVQSSLAYTLLDDLENLTLTGSLAINGTGNAGVNILIGNTAANTLDGGAGADTMRGGAGNDKYIVDDTNDIVTENASAGTDLVEASATFTLGANVENLTLTGIGDINGTGNALVNTLTGNDGDNTLDGAAGNDILVGGLGDDTLIGGLGSDKLTGGGGADYFVFDAATGSTNVDTIADFVSATDVINLDSAIFTALSSGALGGTSFVSAAGAAAVAGDENDYVIYDTASGKLYYDADGSGAGAKVQIATLTGNPTLLATDIVVL